MARENQGLQIALIILVILTLFLGVFTFVFYKQYQQQRLKAEAAEQEANDATTAANKIQEDFNLLKERAGFAASETIDTITEDVNRDMQTYVATLVDDESISNYRDALKELARVLGERNESLAKAQQVNEGLKRDLVLVESQKRGVVDQHEKRADAAEAEQRKQKAAFDDFRVATSEQFASLRDALKSAQEKADTQIAQLQQDLDNAQTTIKDQTGIIEDHVETITDILKPTFELPDGKIRWVNQRNQTVWIDLGRAHAVRPLMTFSVYPVDTNDVTKVGKKASIEVTQILGDSLSEARITEEELSDPIMAGDPIHTPVWAPGQREHFALMDGMDIDANGKPEPDEVISIITASGGVVDCYLTETGDLANSLTNKTRYLVMGSEPPITDPERLKKRSAFLDQCDQRGLTRITLPELLHRMGWKRPTRVIRLGPGANPADFRAKPPEGGPRTSTGNVFRPRTPPPRPSRSAY